MKANEVLYRVLKVLPEASNEETRALYFLANRARIRLNNNDDSSFTASDLWVLNKVETFLKHF